MSLQTTLFMFVRSLREANFEMFLACLKAIIPWMFALDHTHYAWWLPIYIQDLERLPLDDPALYQHFTDGHFTVKKTERNFSNIATDQAHKQNNKLVKISGGAVGILDSPAALLKWSIAGPEIKHMLESLDGSLDYTDFVDDEDNENGLHHEDTKVFENRFRDDINSFFEELNSRGNPFLLL